MQGFGLAGGGVWGLRYDRGVEVGMGVLRSLFCVARCCAGLGWIVEAYLLLYMIGVSLTEKTEKEEENKEKEVEKDARMNYLSYCTVLLLTACL